MGRSSKAPEAPKPDPNIGRAALAQAEMGQAWLDFSKEAFKISEARQVELDAITKEIANQQIEIGETQFDWAKSDRARYESTFKPLEDEFIREASNYGSEERQDSLAAEARSDVLSAAAGERAAAQRDAASMGLNPASGRFAGLSRASELGTALGAAGAETNARQMVRDKGLALKADVANLGRGLPAQSAQATALGLNAGGSAAGLYGAANQQYLASTGIMGQGYRGAMAGYAGQASTLNQQYGQQLDAWRTQVSSQNTATSALFGGIGTILGAGIMRSDENLKEDKSPIPEGEALDAIRDMRVEEWSYKDGVADEGRHIGTYAQDFQAATGKGDGRTINLQDAIGLTMKAVQDLDAKVEGLAGALNRKGGKMQATASEMPGEMAGETDDAPPPPPPPSEPPGLAGGRGGPPGLLIAIAPAGKRSPQRQPPKRQAA
jgi:hypothetical protein